MIDKTDAGEIVGADQAIAGVIQPGENVAVWVGKAGEVMEIEDLGLAVGATREALIKQDRVVV